MKQCTQTQTFTDAIVLQGKKFAQEQLHTKGEMSEEIEVHVQKRHFGHYAHIEGPNLEYDVKHVVVDKERVTYLFRPTPENNFITSNMQEGAIV